MTEHGETVLDARIRETRLTIKRCRELDDGSLAAELTIGSLRKRLRVLELSQPIPAQTAGAKT